MEILRHELLNIMFDNSSIFMGGVALGVTSLLYDTIIKQFPPSVTASIQLSPPHQGHHHHHSPFTIDKVT